MGRGRQAGIVCEWPKQSNKIDAVTVSEENERPLSSPCTTALAEPAAVAEEEEEEEEEEDDDDDASGAVALLLCGGGICVATYAMRPPMASTPTKALTCTYQQNGK